MKYTAAIVSVPFVLSLSIISANAQGSPESVVTSLYNFAVNSKQISEMDRPTLVRFFVESFANEIVENSETLRRIKFDALYGVRDPQIAALSVGKAEMMYNSLVKGNIAFVPVNFSHRGQKQMIHMLLRQVSGGAWRIMNIGYDPMSVRTYSLSYVLAMGEAAIPKGVLTAEEKATNATIAGVVAAASSGKPADALAAYSKAIQLQPSAAPGYINRCIEYKRLKRYAEALSDCNKAVSLQPTLWSAFYFRAELFRETGNKSGALQDLSKVISLENDISSAYYLRALLYKEAKNYDAAIDDLDRVIELDFANLAIPGVGQKDIYFHRGVCSYLKGDHEQTIENMNEVLRRDAGVANAYHIIGWTHMGRKDYSPAITAFTSMIKLSPGDFDAFNSRGLAYAFLKNFQPALSDINRAIQLKPTLAELYETRAIIYRGLGNRDLAAKDDQTAIRLGKQ